MEVCLAAYCYVLILEFTDLSGKKYKGFYRLRISDFRIIYRIDEKTKSVTILTIGHRRLIYQN